MSLPEGLTDIGKKNLEIKYTERQMTEYKERLAHALIKDGLDAETIGNDPDVKTYIKNYVDQNIMSVKPKDLLLGFTYRLANMYLDRHNNASTEHLSFPIINKYHKHDLIESTYFTKTPLGIEIRVIPVLTSTIIL